MTLIVVLYFMYVCIYACKYVFAEVDKGALPKPIDILWTLMPLHAILKLDPISKIILLLS